MERQDITLLGGLGFAHVFFSVLRDYDVIHLAYPIFVGWLFLYSVVYLIIERSRFNALLFSVGSASVISFLYQIYTHGRIINGSPIHPWIHYMLAVILFIYGVQGLIQNLQTRYVKSAQKKREHNLDVYDETYPTDTKHFK